MPYNAALQACSAIGESLADPHLFNSSLNLSLTLSHLWKVAPPPLEQLFWVQSSNNVGEAINMAGKLAAIESSRSLPALCTQSAPPSNGTFADTNEKWQIGVKLANYTITGFGFCFPFYFFNFILVSFIASHLV